jgi:tetratricopeptide (TPR) repeat protein
MYAFGLEETGRYKEAEQVGLRALRINKKDAWALHAVVHVMEMQGRQAEGIKFILDREQDWTDAVALACHNYWHLALHYIERGEFENAKQVFDRETCERVKSGAILDLVDGSSLLYRLLFEGQISRDDARWRGMGALWESHIHDHVLTFNDVHIAMNFDNQDEVFIKFLESWQKYVEQNFGPSHTNHIIAKDVANDIIRAIIAFNDQRFEDAADLLYPLHINKQINKIGGSHAQRDVIEQLLLNVLVQAPSKRDITLPLLQQRKNRKRNSGVTDRLIARASKN